MNIAIEFFIQHVMIILIFALIYLGLGTTHFYGPKDHNIDFVDAFYFSISTQTTVGYNDFTPKSEIAKIIVIIQLFSLFFITSSAAFGFSLFKTFN